MIFSILANWNNSIQLSVIAGGFVAIVLFGCQSNGFREAMHAHCELDAEAMLYLLQLKNDGFDPIVMLQTLCNESVDPTEQGVL
jgi:hypothetical protein